jgi:hypothetical protein
MQTETFYTAPTANILYYNLIVKVSLLTAHYFDQRERPRLDIVNARHFLSLSIYQASVHTKFCDLPLTLV